MRRYIIVTGHIRPYGKEVDNIEDLVEEKLDKGYSLSGPLLHIQKNEYAQAMVLK